MLEFANDFRMNVDDLKSAENSLERQNCMWSRVMHKGEPHIVILASRRIAPGAELLVDYSDEYWVQTQKEKRGNARSDDDDDDDASEQD
jgi:SET domain-containing protein